MNEKAFHNLLQLLEYLSPSQMSQLQSQLQRHESSTTEALVTAHKHRCPHCHSANVRPWGSSHNLPRYRCGCSGRTSNPLTGTPLARLRKRDRWMCYAQALIDGQSIRRAAAQCGVDKNSAFLWRHCFLTLAAEHQARQEHGIIEADETFFLESFKGQRKLPRPARQRGGVSKTRGTGPDQIPVLVVRDRAGATADFILQKLDGAHVSEALKPLVDPDACLCTDGAAVYKFFARTTGIVHQAVSAQGPRTRGPFIFRTLTRTIAALRTG